MVSVRGGMGLGGCPSNSDVWTLGWRHALTQVESRVGRLIVPDVLPCDSQSICRVLHQRDKAVRRWFGSGKDVKFPVICGAPDDFLPPVAQDVRTKAGITLGAVIGRAAELGSIEKDFGGFALRVPFLNGRTIEQFP